jgi:hypothetical protein
MISRRYIFESCDMGSIKDLRSLTGFMISQMNWKHLQPLTATRKIRTLRQNNVDLQWRQ